MRTPRIRFVAACAVSLLAAAPLGAAAAEETESPTERHLAAIAASLERIERALSADRALRIVELRYRRLDLLRAELAPLESELRSLRADDSYLSPEIKLQEERLRILAKQVEEAELGGEPGQLESLESERQNLELIVRSHRDRLKLQTARAEELEAQLSVLRADRDAAVGEVERLLAWAENQGR
jgi:hypothetical protein